VLHVLGLVRNLLSVSKLIELGLLVVFSDASVKSVRGTMVIGRGVYKHKNHVQPSRGPL